MRATSVGPCADVRRNWIYLGTVCSRLEVASHCQETAGKSSALGCSTSTFRSPVKEFGWNGAVGKSPSHRRDALVPIRGLLERVSNLKHLHFVVFPTDDLQPDR